MGKSNLDLTLERGRIHLVNRKAAGAARVRLRFRSEAWEVELREPMSQVVADLWIDLARPEALDSPPPAHLLMHSHGSVEVNTGKQSHTLSNSMKLHWRSQTPAAVSPEKLAHAPEWWTKGPALTADSVKDAMAAMVAWKAALSGSAEVLDATRTGINNSSDRKDREVGVLFLGALDAPEPLLTFMMGHPNIEVRNTAASALRLWLNRSLHHADELTRLLHGQKYAADKVTLVLKLLRGYTQAELAQPATYQSLIDYLNHDELIVRDLAHVHLWFRVPSARKISFNPIWNEEQRKPALTAWRNLVPKETIPPLPQRPPAAQ